MFPLGQASIQQITAKLRTMEITKNLELLIDRQIDEIDVLNILEGHANHFLIHTKVETDLVERNSQLRSNRINERIQLVHLLQNHIETERLKRITLILLIRAKKEEIDYLLRTIDFE